MQPGVCSARRSGRQVNSFSPFRGGRKMLGGAHMSSEWGRGHGQGPTEPPGWMG